MRTIHTEIGIGAPAAKVWDVLIATDQWAEWNLLVVPIMWWSAERRVEDSRP